ncbi:MAG: hypothetical protein IT582_06030 [Opitutaceae bacterium]|nr:hypothetical protein [Opitutaceae bacterium]
MDNDYALEPVPPTARGNTGRFWNLYAGEHAAGTEFMIGPLFIAAGVGARDLLLGLLLGNLCAVLTWRGLTMPIAAEWRLTLYRQLEIVAGRKFVTVYNLANALLFCALAGAMVTVSATAVGVVVPIPMPQLDAFWPTGAGWIAVVAVIGALFTLFAAIGYEWVARVANWCAPLLLVGFLACGLVALPKLDVHGLGDFARLAGEIWTGGEPLPGQIKFTFWHVFFFTWCCNAAMHLGMADLSILRFAKSRSAGWAPAGGMYLGHYMAWIAASLLYAVQLRADPASTAVLPGPLAYNAIGIAGLLCVIVAGWTTANPTIYRAGLAVHALWPGSSRFLVTAGIGLVVTIIAMFPIIAMRLLDFVGLYGMILAPVGALLAVDHFILRKGRAAPGAAPRQRDAWMFYAAWFGALALCAIPLRQGVFASFLTVPAWLLCGALFWALHKFAAKSGQAN